MKPFSELFPLSSYQFSQLVQVEPDEVLGGRNTWRGRRVVGELLGREVFLFLFQMPFYVVFNLMLLIGKISETIWRTLLLCKPSISRGKRFKAVSLSTIDHALLVPVLPLFRLGLVGKLMIASIFPKIYFKRPADVSPLRRQAYYRKCVHGNFDQLLDHRGVTLENRTVLHNFRKGVVLVDPRIVELTDRIDFYRRVYRHLSEIQKGISERRLEAFDADLRGWGQKVGLDLPSCLMVRGESENLE